MHPPVTPLSSADARPLLPNEPRVLDWPGEQALTERYLLPLLPQLDAFFLEVRAQVDTALSKVKPVKHGKPYPLGQCLEISLAVKQNLSQLVPDALQGSAAQGHAALADARFTPVEDFAHYARTAARYWNCEVYPNHVLPTLAPYFPLISVIPGGGVRFQSASDYMIALVEAGEFRPSEAVLDAALLDDDLFRLISRCLLDSGRDIVADPVEGRASALKHCAAYRAKGRHRDSEQRSAAVHAIGANHCLRRLAVQVRGAR